MWHSEFRTCIGLVYGISPTMSHLLISWDLFITGCTSVGPTCNLVCHENKMAAHVRLLQCGCRHSKFLLYVSLCLRGQMQSSNQIFSFLFCCIILLHSIQAFWLLSNIMEWVSLCGVSINFARYAVDQRWQAQNYTFCDASLLYILVLLAKTCSVAS